MKSQLKLILAAGVDEPVVGSDGVGMALPELRVREVSEGAETLEASGLSGITDVERRQAGTDAAAHVGDGSADDVRVPSCCRPGVQGAWRLVLSVMEVSTLA